MQKNSSKIEEFSSYQKKQINKLIKNKRKKLSAKYREERCFSSEDGNEDENVLKKTVRYIKHVRASQILLL